MRDKPRFFGLPQVLVAAIDGNEANWEFMDEVTLASPPGAAAAGSAAAVALAAAAAAVATAHELPAAMAAARGTSAAIRHSAGGAGRGGGTRGDEKAQRYERELALWRQHKLVRYPCHAPSGGGRRHACVPLACPAAE